MDEFQFKIGEELRMYNWPNKDILRCRTIERRRVMFTGQEREEYRVELLNDDSQGRRRKGDKILLFEKDLWRENSKQFREKGGRH